MQQIFTYAKDFQAQVESMSNYLKLIVKSAKNSSEDSIEAHSTVILTPSLSVVDNRFEGYIVDAQNKKKQDLKEESSSFKLSDLLGKHSGPQFLQSYHDGLDLAILILLVTTFFILNRIREQRRRNRAAPL